MVPGTKLNAEMKKTQFGDVTFPEILCTGNNHSLSLSLSLFLCRSLSLSLYIYIYISVANNAILKEGFVGLSEGLLLTSLQRQELNLTHPRLPYLVYG